MNYNAPIDKRLIITQGGLKNVTAPSLNFLCTTDLTQDIWTENQLDGSIDFLTSKLVPFPSGGVVAALVAHNPDLAGDSFNCDFDATCSNGVLGKDTCLGNPLVNTILDAVVNFSNFWQHFRSVLLGQQLSFLLTQADSMPTTFGPPAGAAGSDLSYLNPFASAGLAATIAGGFIGLVPDVGPAAAAIVGTLGAFVGKAGSTPAANETDFATTTSITRGLGLMTDAIMGAITFMVEDVLINMPQETDADTYNSDITQLPHIISGGGHAVPIVDDSLGGGLTAVLASPIISNLWNAASVIVVKATLLSLDVNPCTLPADQDIYFPGFRFCKGDQMFVLQTYPLNSDNWSQTDTGQGAVPGFASLPQSNITPQAVVLGSDNA